MTELGEIIKQQQQLQRLRPRLSAIFAETVATQRLGTFTSLSNIDVLQSAEEKVTAQLDHLEAMKTKVNDVVQELRSMEHVPIVGEVNE